MDITRSATATWTGDVRSGGGTASTQSGALKDVKITWSSRFESQPGSNPEELIAAAHAACFSMALSSRLTQRKTPPREIHTKATLTMKRDDAGVKITKIHLDTQGSVPGIDEATFKAEAMEAKATCPISVLLAPGLEEITLNASLTK